MKRLKAKAKQRLRVIRSLPRADMRSKRSRWYLNRTTRQMPRPSQAERDRFYQYLVAPVRK